MEKKSGYPKKVAVLRDENGEITGYSIIARDFLKKRLKVKKQKDNIKI
jgi:hypothetical protein